MVKKKPNQRHKQKADYVIHFHSGKRLVPDMVHKMPSCCIRSPPLPDRWPYTVRLGKETLRQMEYILPRPRKPND